MSWKLRLFALGLALCLTLALAACTGTSHPGGPADPTPEGAAAATATPAQTGPADPSEEALAPSAAPALTQAPSPSGEAAPEASPSAPAPDPMTDPIPDKGTPPPAATHHPDDHHTAAPTPAATSVPTPEPTPTPTPTPAPDPSEPAQAGVSADEVYAAVSAAAGVSYDDSSPYLAAYYPSLDTDDLLDYVLYMPAMSAQIEEIFLARVKSGKLEDVKAACQARQQGMAEDAAAYGSTGAYVESYQLLTQGDWILFCVCENAAQAVEAFQNSAK